MIFRSTRYETDRWDSPIEGFVFRLWQWRDPADTFTFGKPLYDEADVTQATTAKSPSTKKQVSTVNIGWQRQIKTIKTFLI